MIEIGPFGTNCFESNLGVLFAVLVDERRRIDGIIERAKRQDRQDPRIERAEKCGAVVDDRIHMWLSRWEGREPPN
jgi:hypothetical protein